MSSVAFVACGTLSRFAILARASSSTDGSEILILFFAEVFFGNYISDYVPRSAALIIAFIWRLMTYYAYLIAGVIIVPTWLNGVIKRRREERLASKN